MARVDPQQGLAPSIFNRLDPTSQGAGQQGYTLADMMEAVRRDLEDLLNTRQTLGVLAGQRERLRKSILGYGLPEVNSMPANTPQQKMEIARVLEATVARHEPRLRNIRVTLLEGEANKQPTLRFRIDARLAVEPAPEVAFDSLTGDSGQLTVRLANMPNEP